MKNSLKRIMCALLCVVMVLGYFTFGKPELTGTEADAISVGVNPTPSIDIAVNIPDDYPGDFEMFREEMTDALARALCKELYGTDKPTEAQLAQAQSLFRITNTEAILDTTSLEGWYVYDHYRDLTAYNAVIAATASTTAAQNAQKLKQPYRLTSDSHTSGKNVNIQDYFLNADGTAKSVAATVQNFNQHTYSWVNKQTGASNMIFAGYGTNAYWDFMAYPAEASSRRTIEFDLDCAAVNTHTLAGAGFLLNTSIGDVSSYNNITSRLNGYALYLRWSGSDVIPEIIYFNNYAPTVDAGMTRDVKATGVTQGGMSSGTKVRFSVVIKEDSVVVLMRRYTNGVLGEAVNIFNGRTKSNSTGAKGSSTDVNYAVPLPNSPGGCFGPLVNYTSHACSAMSYFTFGDLQMGVGQTAFDALKNVQYYQGAKQKYFINLASVDGKDKDAHIPDESDSQYLQSYIDGIQRMDTEEIFYISDADDGAVLHYKGDGHGGDCDKLSDSHKSLTGSCHSKENDFCHLESENSPNGANHHRQANGYYATQGANQGLSDYEDMASFIARNFANNVPYYHGENTSPNPLANFYITNVSDDVLANGGKATQLMTVHLQHYKDNKEQIIKVNIADKSLPNKDGVAIRKWALKVMDENGQTLQDKNKADKYGGADGLVATEIKTVGGVRQPVFYYAIKGTYEDKGGPKASTTAFEGFQLSYKAYEEGELNTGRYILQLQVWDEKDNVSSIFQTYLTIFVDKEAPEGTITNTAKNQINVNLVDTGEGILDDGITFEGANRGSGVNAYSIVHAIKGSNGGYTFTVNGEADSSITKEKLESNTTPFVPAEGQWKYLSAPVHEFDLPINLAEKDSNGQPIYNKGDVIYIYYKDECDNAGAFKMGKLIEVEVQDADGVPQGDSFLIVGPPDNPPPGTNKDDYDVEFGWLPDDVPPPPADYPDDSEFSNWTEGDKDIDEGTPVPKPGDDDSIVIQPKYSSDTVGFYFHANAADATVNDVTDAVGAQVPRSEGKGANNDAGWGDKVTDNAAVRYNVPLGASVKGKANSLVANPQREGYTFLYWSLQKSSEDANGKYNGAKLKDEKVKADINYKDATKTEIESFANLQNNHVYAQWQINSYKLYFNRNGGTSGGPSARYVKYKTNLWTGVLSVLENDPVRPGYEFVGWSEDPNATTAAECITANSHTDVTMPASDKTLYAVWKKDNSSIRLNFYANGGTDVGAKVYTKSDFANGAKNFEYLAAPTKAGYIFAGWYWWGKVEDPTSETMIKDFTGKKAITAGAEVGDGTANPNADPKVMNSDGFLGADVHEKQESEVNGDYWLVAKWIPGESIIYLDYMYNTGYEGTEAEGAVKTGTDEKYYFYEPITEKQLHAKVKTESPITYDMVVSTKYIFQIPANQGKKGLNKLIGVGGNTWDDAARKLARDAIKAASDAPVGNQTSYKAAMQFVYDLYDSNSSHFNDPTKSDYNWNTGEYNSKVKIENFTIVPDTVTSATGSVYWYDHNNAKNLENEENGFEAQPGEHIKVYYDRLYNIAADVQTVPSKGNAFTQTVGEEIMDETGRLWTPTEGAEEGAVGIIGTKSNGEKAGGVVSIEATTGKLDAIFRTVEKDGVGQNAVLGKYGRSVTVTWKPESGYYVSAILVDGVSRGDWIPEDPTEQGSYTFDGGKLGANHHIVVVFKQGKAPTGEASILMQAEFQGNYDGTCYFLVNETDSADATRRETVKDKVVYNSNYTFNWELGPGYSLVDVIVDGVSLGTTTNTGTSEGLSADRKSYEFKTVKNDHKVIVVVEKLPTNGGSKTTGYYTVTVNVYGGDDKVKTDPSAVVEQGSNYRVAWNATASEDWDVYRVEVNGKNVVEYDKDYTIDAAKERMLPSMKPSLQDSYQTFTNIQENYVVDIYLVQKGTEGAPKYDEEHYVRLTTVLQGGPGAISGGNVYRLKESNGKTDKITVTWTVENLVRFHEVESVTVNGVETKDYKIVHVNKTKEEELDGIDTYTLVFASGISEDTVVVVTLKPVTYRVNVIPYGPGTVSDSKTVWRYGQYLEIEGQPEAGYGLARVVVRGEDENAEPILDWTNPNVKTESEQLRLSARAASIATYANDLTNPTDDTSVSYYTLTNTGGLLVDITNIKQPYTVEAHFTQILNPDTGELDVPTTVENGHVVTGSTNIEGIDLKGTKGGVTPEDSVELTWEAEGSYDYDGATITVGSGENKKEYTVKDNGDGTYSVVDPKTGKEVDGITIDVESETIEQDGKKVSKGKITITGITEDMDVIVNLDVANNTDTKANNQRGKYTITAEIIEGDGEITGNGIEHDSDKPGTVSWEPSSDVKAPSLYPDDGKTERAKFKTREFTIDGKKYTAEDIIKWAKDPDNQPKNVDLTYDEATGNITGYIDGVYVEFKTESFYTQGSIDKALKDVIEDIVAEAKEAGEKARDDADAAAQEKAMEDAEAAANKAAKEAGAEEGTPYEQLTPDQKKAYDAAKKATYDKVYQEELDKAYKNAYDKAYDSAYEQAVKDAKAGALKNKAGEPVTDEDGNPVKLEKDTFITEGSLTFTDGENHNVDISLYDPDIPQEHPQPTRPPMYNVEVEDTPNGTTRTDRRSARKGQDVTIYPEPDKGYKPGSVHVHDKDGNEILVTGPDEDGNYHFTQPEGNVTVIVEYVPDDEPKKPSNP